MTDPPTPCSSPEASQFDFWLGEWDLSWPAEQTGGEAGEMARGTNRIEKLFGRCAIEENFATDDGRLLGRSLSVFDPSRGLWQQTWVDSIGSYLLFAGAFDGTVMELRSSTVVRDGKPTINRMVFHDIAADSLRWDWQRSDDGARSWRDLWTIRYERRA